MLQPADRDYLALTHAAVLVSVRTAATDESCSQGSVFGLSETSTRVVIETTGDFEFRRDRVPDPDRLFFDLQRQQADDSVRKRAGDIQGQ